MSSTYIPPDQPNQRRIDGYVTEISSQRSREHTMYRRGARVIVTDPGGQKLPGRVIACTPGTFCSCVTVEVAGQTRRVAADRVIADKRSRA